MDAEVRNPPISDAWKPMRVRPLLMPVDYEAIPEALVDLSTSALQRVLAGAQSRRVTLVGTCRVRRRRVRGVERPVASVIDDAGNKVFLRTPAFDLLNSVLAARDGRQVLLYGRLVPGRAVWLLRDPEPIQPRWLGRPRPVYDAHHWSIASMFERQTQDYTGSVLEKPKVQIEMRASIAHEPTYRDYIRESAKQLFRDGLRDKESREVGTGDHTPSGARAVFEALVANLHFPRSHKALERALHELDRIAAVSAIAETVLDKVKTERRGMRSLHKLNVPRLAEGDEQDLDATIDALSADFPFRLTQEQRRVAKEILGDIQEGLPMRRVLSGDVGSGKTAVFTVAIAAMLKAGYRVGLMVPTQELAHQSREKIRELMPDVALSFVTREEREIDPDALLWIGTYGLTYVRDLTFDLLVVDEQQKFSPTQREYALRSGGHLLEVTATCIPRTQALVSANVWGLSQLTGCPVPKTFHNRIWWRHEREAAFAAIRTEVERGGKVLIFYPLREGRPDNDRRVRQAVKAVASMWENAFPGQVGICHAQMSKDEKQSAIADFNAGRTRIMVATRVLEVGMDVKGVTRVSVIRPEMFGLATLHQFRGRAAREGGEARFDMIVTTSLSSRSHDALRKVESCTDGFELAKYDMSLRGAGDARETGSRQSGHLPDSPFKDRPLSMAVIEEVADELEAAYRRRFEIQDAKRQTRRGASLQ